MGTRTAAWRAALGLSLVLASVVAAGCAGESRAVATTARVERATVATKVFSSGSLAAVTSQKLGFPEGAQLEEVNVEVGDRVRPGQVLARLDDFAFQQQLNQQQAQLANQQAQLDRLVNGNTVEQARRTLEQAQQVLSATQRNVAAVGDANSSATERARQQREFAEDRFEAARASNPNCDADGAPEYESEPGDTGYSPDGQGSPGLLGLTPPGEGPDGSGRQGGGMGLMAADCSEVAAAKANLISASAAVDAAEHKEETDRSQGQISIENARQSVVTARNNLDSAGTSRPADIDAQRALVDNARAAVALARRDLENTVLYAPVAGTVAAVDGAVGEFVDGRSGTTALAPGTGAALPELGAGAGSQNSGLFTGGDFGTGQPFIVLSDVATFQVVVPFVEFDATQISPNQPVEVTFDAIPDLVRRGSVLSIAPAGSDIAGTTSYYVTVVLSETDPRLRAGQTAEVGVLTERVDNVLTVPNAAVSRQGARSFVTVLGPEGEPVPVPFEPGLVGSDKTQVLSGLPEGQPLVLPQANVLLGSNGQGPR